jgi:glycosyltransferase involved in cell wall biosynthesis
MRHEMIICTRNRPNELTECLKSVTAQSTLPDRVIIVDSSETDSTRDIVERFAEHAGMKVEFARAAARKAIQLNVGLDLLDDSTEIVHFTDDDVVLDVNYLAEILMTFQSHPDCGGVGGRMSNLPKRRAKRLARWFRSVFLLDSKREGALLSSGYNVLCRASRSPQQVDWLPGGSMSYRVPCIAGLRFDEARAGNGMGGDIDFSARVAARAKLIWTPSPVLEHRGSPINRENDLMARRRIIRSRWRLAKRGVGPVSRAAVLYSIAGDTIILLAMAGGFRSRLHLREAVANIAGVIDITKGAPV